MKKVLLIASIALFSLSSCKKETETVIETVTVNADQPNGTFSAQRSGTFVEQNSTGTMGEARIGNDSNGDQFVYLTNGFISNFGTGTLTIYLSTSMDYVPDPMNGNPNLKLLGVVTQSGNQYYKVDMPVEENFSHVILWCASANIPFGYAALN